MNKTKTTGVLFTVGIFAGSFMLFLIQPMVGKILLPLLGGAPAVWTTCMLFFQAALLAGYLYADKSIALLGCNRQSVLHLMLMIGSWLLLPVSIDTAGLETAHASPASWLLSRLTASIGLLFFLLAANAPLLQRYYSQSGQPDADKPYFLYAASNAGSLLALLAFPFILEPFMGAGDIRRLWSAGYILLTLILGACSFMIWKQTENYEPSTPSTGQGRLRNQKSQAEAHKPEKLCGNASPSTGSGAGIMAPGWGDNLRWAFYGFLPCSAMLAVTTHITADIASAPLLWILPLAGYLLSFILAFARSSYWRQVCWQRYLFPVTLLCLLMYYYVLTERAWLSIGMHLLFMMLTGMFFHARLASNAPSARFLNRFYVWISAGGVAAGLFNGILAPMLFKTQFEYFLTMLAAALTVAFLADRQLSEGLTLRRETLVSMAFGLVFCLLTYYSRNGADDLFSIDTAKQLFFAIFLIHLYYRMPFTAGASLLLIFAMLQATGTPSETRVLHRERSFFGILKVSRLSTDGQTRDSDLKIAGVVDIFHRLHHGHTLHGVERRVKVRERFPLSYYSREGPIGALFRTGLINRNCKNIGVVGLGAGTLAWYGRSWQSMDFFEIDPAMIRIARNPEFFSFLTDSQAAWRIIAGDARVKLHEIPDSSYDLLIIDAYSSGSVPMHLLTLQAFELYRSKIRPDGLIVFHVSNRYLKLEPIIRRICDQLGMNCLEAFYEPERDSIRYDWYDQDQMAGSHWVAASPRREKLDLLKNTGLWKPMPEYANYKLWTDDYASLLQVYNWR